MRRKNQIGFGIVIILFGMMLLISNITGIRLWSYIWPLLIVGLGIWMITRPQRFRQNSEMQFRFLGGMNYPEGWTLKNEYIFSIIGEMHMDLSQAVIPSGETILELRGFVADIDVTVPADAGIKVKSHAFVTSADAFGDKQDYFLTQYEAESENYVEAEQKIMLDLGFFVTDVNVIHLDN